MSLRIRRGTEAQRTSHIFDQGEIVYTTDQGKLFIGDGQTAGGVHVLKTSVGVGFTFNELTQRIDFSVPSLNLTTASVAEDSSRLYFTNTRAKDAIGEALVTGPHNGITFTYNHDTGVISATVTEGINALLPSQSGQNGKWLTTDGSTVSWATAPLGGLSFPSPSGHQSQFLTTADGSTLSWATPTTANLVNGAYSVQLGSNGKTTFQGDLLLASTVDIKRDIGGGIYSSVLGGLSHISQDLSPALGGNLDLGGHNVTGTGDINTTGSLQVTGTIQGGALTAESVQSNGTITAALDISTYGNFYALGTIGSTGGLGTDLILNEFNITSTGAGKIDITGDIITSGNLNASGATISGATTGAFPLVPLFTISAFRGTISSPTTTVADDILTGIRFSGYNGSSYSSTGFVFSKLDSDAVLSNRYPKSSLIFATGAGASTYHSATLSSNGAFSAPILQTGSYPTGSYPANPVAGMIIFDNTSNHFYGYNGTSWVAFTGP